MVEILSASGCLCARVSHDEVHLVSHFSKKIDCLPQLRMLPCEHIKRHASSRRFPGLPNCGHTRG
jgi:hypothetical protein